MHKYPEYSKQNEFRDEPLWYQDAVQHSRSKLSKGGQQHLFRKKNCTLRRWQRYLDWLQPPSSTLRQSSAQDRHLLVTLAWLCSKYLLFVPQTERCQQAKLVPTARQELHIYTSGRGAIEFTVQRQTHTLYMNCHRARAQIHTDSRTCITQCVQTYTQTQTLETKYILSPSLNDKSLILTRLGNIWLISGVP